MNHQSRRMRQILAEHNPGPEYALVECIDCPASARIDDTNSRTTDDIRREFEALGWTISPTRCPRCVERAR